MGAPDILAHLHAAGVSLSRKGDKLIASPREAVTPEIVDLIRAHKPELLEALRDPVAEARRQRVLAKLEDNPEAPYAVVTDSEADPQAVILALAIRGRATCELRIPRDRYDPFLLLDLIERHCGTIH